MIRLARASFFSVFFVFTIVSGAELVNAQPAPGLTSMRVTHVASPNYKNGTEYEPIPANYLATPSDHGGRWLIVVVEETGYANGQYASFAGVSMKLAKSEALYGADRRVYGYRIQQLCEFNRLSLGNKNGIAEHPLIVCCLMKPVSGSTTDRYSLSYV
jgi:hypothetical protein